MAPASSDESPADGSVPDGPGTGAVPQDGSPALQVRAVQVVNRRGLHARAAAKFVKEAERFSACVNVRKNGSLVSARSIMGLMMLGAARGDSITIRVEGEGEEAALKKLVGLVMDGFGED